MSLRRSNKSHKVPNVKLRPIQSTFRRQPSPLASSPVSSPPCQDGLPSSYVDPCPRPLRGIILCTTGVDKATIFSKASEMGATTMVDLRDTVTHLIADRPVGAKYRCAVEQKIPIVKSTWILKNFEVWLRGDMFDVKQTLEQHRLPIFEGVVLCVSGFEDVHAREEMNRQVTKHGGKFVKNLERPVRVTHLLCTGNQETDKMKYARKFNERGEADIKLVWEEWYQDCLEYGGQFDETPYLVENPRPTAKAPSQRFPTPSLDIPEDPIPPGPSKGPLIPEPIVEEEEIASAKRVPAVTLRVWESLLKSRGFVQEGNKLIRAETELEAVKSQRDVEKHGNARIGEDVSRQPPRPPASFHPIPPKKGQSALATFSRNQSFAAPRSETEQAKQPFRRAVSNGPATGHDSPASKVIAEPAPYQTPIKLGIFSGVHFRARGEARSPSVRGAVEGCGGIWIDGDDEREADIILVRLVSGSVLYRTEADEAERAKYRTECWMEACLSRERVCEADEHISFTPLGIELPIPGANDIVLSPSGLDVAEDIWIKRLARALGITHAPTFSRGSTHLLCPAGAGQKFERAQEWGTPVISLEWLTQMAKTGIVHTVFDYLVLYPAGQGAQAKGKQKAADAPEGTQRKVNMWTPSPSRRPNRAASVNMAEPVGNEDILGRQTYLLSKRRASSAGNLVAAQEPRTPTHRSNSKKLSPSSPAAKAPLSQLDSNAMNVDDSETDPESDDDPPHPPSSRLTGIPSSRTPSPIKARATDGSIQGTPKSSPLRPAVSEEAARKLRETLTVLGKRTSIDDVGAHKQSRLGKRARPRSKQHLEQKLQAPQLIPESNATLALADDLDTSFIPSEETRSLTNTHGGLVYEDAGQRQERMRLISLLGEANDRTTKAQSRSKLQAQGLNADESDDVEIVEVLDSVPRRGAKPKPRPVGRAAMSSKRKAAV